MTPSIWPKVSIVVPLYNARDVIKGTIESVLSQTFQDYEIVVVDDGSVDGSGDIVRGLDPRLRYVRQANGGVAKARNRGIAEAQGRYIALLDHDDLWHPTKLEKQVKVLDERQEIGMVITDVSMIDRSGRLILIAESAYRPSVTFARLFVQGYEPTPSAAMIRRSVLDAVGGFDEDFDSAGLDDQELWPRIAAYCPITMIGEPLTFHRVSVAKPAEIELRHQPVLIMKLLERFGHDPRKRRYLLAKRAAWLSDLGKQCTQKGYCQEGRSYLRKGLALSLGEGRNLRTAWRCLSRLVRSYLNRKAR